MEAKNELRNNESLRNQLMAGRESFVVFKENQQRQVANSQISTVLSTDFRGTQQSAASQNPKLGLFAKFQQ